MRYKDKSRFVGREEVYAACYDSHIVIVMNGSSTRRFNLWYDERGCLDSKLKHGPIEISSAFGV